MNAFDGIDVDYERVPAALWDRYAELAERVGAALHARLGGWQGVRRDDHAT